MPENENESRKTASASAVLLCFGAGATDVLSYLTLGKIFTSAMTGCAALLFIKATGGDVATALRAALALASYVVGCAMLPVRRHHVVISSSTPDSVGPLRERGKV